MMALGHTVDATTAAHKSALIHAISLSLDLLRDIEKGNESRAVVHQGSAKTNQRHASFNLPA
jgi:hypothetical protein